MIAPTPPTLWDAVATAHQQELRREADQARLAHMARLARSRSRGGQARRGRVVAAALGHTAASLAAWFLQPPPSGVSVSGPDERPPAATVTFLGRHPSSQ